MSYAEMMTAVEMLKAMKADKETVQKVVANAFDCDAIDDGGFNFLICQVEEAFGISFDDQMALLHDPAYPFPDYAHFISARKV